MRSRRAVIAVIALAVVGAVVGATVLVDTGSDTGGRAATGTFASSRTSGGWTPVAREAPEDWRPQAAELPHGAGEPGTMRVADGLAPPTNRWYSGMFFGDVPQPVFALPLAVQAQPDGVIVGLPKVSATERTITAPFAPDFRVGLPTDAFEATRADPVSVTAGYTSAGTPAGKLQLAEGWPYAAYTAERDQAVTLPAGLTARDGGQWLGSTVAGTTYGVAVSHADGSHRALTEPQGSLDLAAGESLVIFAGADEATAATLAAGAVPITGTAIGYALDDDTASTRLTYRTAQRRPTVVAAMPHQRVQGSAEPVATIDSLYGPLRLYRGRTVTSDVPAITPTGALDLGRLTDADRTELRRQVRADVAEALAAPAPPTDTYFGGKQVYRLAQLEQVAEASGASKAAAKVRQRAVAVLDDWLKESDSCAAGSTKCFFYDTAFRGVVGREASFGADEFNDHHFHYGYFLAAAALVGQDHPELLQRWRSTLTALAQDIASPVASEQLPALRSFDPFTGHSWASGTSPFADGNNQESSSEAVNAWNGLALWARADGHDQLARQATWQLSLESAAASAYWLQPEHLPQGFDHPFVSLNWGGKREWATWFSAEPSAILGIQLLPMPPVFDQADVDPRRVRANLADTTAQGYDTIFGDYLTMYLAMADPKRALAVGRQLPDSAIDDGNSRSYLLAWLLAHARAAG
ncbi:glycosyl hydrolase [Nocardioides mesophilus]|uniref:glucan endo-1,3-beta-D-glucosidase n=1 Tax=Nocardioides mesophilus TaxID=433659 RepID=A0A7G9R6T5_9ACTN|nr:glycosyl hydrolase [Nocardioides mesophilus]QNN51310.1 1,3-beta-glucanase [Nocardioides mesophilus]